MGTKARGRGVAATFGLLLLLVGIAGGIVLWIMAERRPEQAVDGFARGPVGCTTTLEFTDTGTFYVYEERVGGDIDAFTECEPVPTPGAGFSVELLDDGRPVALRDDASISYDTASAVGESVARVEIDEVGRYDLVVVGEDPQVVAAIGRDPRSGVDELRRGAVIVGVVGVLLGALLLVLAGRRSKRAATYGPPEGPGWGPQERPLGGVAPEPTRIAQQPVDPMLPPEHEQPVAWPPEPPRVGEAASAPAASEPTAWPPEPPRVGEAASAPAASEPTAWPPEPPRVALPAAEPVGSEPVGSEPTAAEPVWPPEPPRVAPPAAEPTESAGAETTSPWAPPQADQRRDPPPPG